MKQSIRFFIIEIDDDSVGQIECSEAEFLAAEGEIEYERHTVFANGVDQVCLTKNPF